VRASALVKRCESPMALRILALLEHDRILARTSRWLSVELRDLVKGQNLDRLEETLEALVLKRRLVRSYRAGTWFYLLTDAVGSASMPTAEPLGELVTTNDDEAER
jgi:hypothetical protein